MAAPEPVTNIVLVGGTGYGKSATGNTLLGQRMFESKKWGRGVTTRCEMYRTAIDDGPIINVIDTPGIDLFDNSFVSADDINKELNNCLTMAEKGIHVVLFVLSARHRLAQKEVESTLDTLQRIFGSKILDYIIVVFTGGDELEDDNQTLDDYLRDGCPDFLTRMLEICGGRKVLFNNKTNDKDKKAEQLQQLLALVTYIGKQNCGIPYTDKLRRMIKELDDNLMKQEMNIKAKNLADIIAMKETLRMEHERTMNKTMMAHIVESDLKQSAAAHKKEMGQLKDTLGLQSVEIIDMVARMVEDALKKDKTANEIHMSMLKEKLELINRLTIGTIDNMAEKALKMSEESHEKEMNQLKNTLQLNDSQTMNMMAQMSAAAHERKMHQHPKTLPLPRLQLECNIM